MNQIEQIRASMLAQNYVFFEQGDYNLNLIAIRENDIFENTFSDTMHCIFKLNGAWQNIAIKWTTLAGTLGHGGEQNPLSAQETGTGVSGTAIIIPSQYRRAYKFIDSYYGWLSYPYFSQISNLKYWRDNNKNYVVNAGIVYEGNYATHLHRMSNNGVESNQVNFDVAAWSQGCNGAPEPDFRKLLVPTREAVKRMGDVFSYTILERKQILS